jgi:hypothetical protein
MFTHYRKKVGGLCYKVLTFRARRWEDWFGECSVIVQHLQGDISIIPEKLFWEEWEGVEFEDLPPAYRKEAERLYAA